MAGWSAARAPLDAALGLLDRSVRLVIVASVGGMVAIVASQVFSRYILNSSIGWADEVSRLLFVWSIFLAIPIGVRRGRHIGVEILKTRLPAQMQSWLERAMTAVGCALMALIAYQALVIALAQWDELMVSIDVSAGWFIVALIVGSAHSALHLLRLTVFGPYADSAAP